MTNPPRQPRHRFARTRRVAGYTQESLAAFLGVERSTVARWESGETEPQPYLRPKLAEALKLPLGELETLLVVPPPLTKIKPISPLNARVGARLQAEREERGWGKYEMARRLFSAAGISNGNLKSLTRQMREWEKGQHYPRDWSKAYAKAFDIDEAELFGSIDTHLSTLGETEEETKRRELLESLAILGVATATQGQALATIRDAFNSSLTLHGDGYVPDDWQEVAYEYAHAYLVTPPHHLMPDLAADLVALQDAIARNKDAAFHRELYSAGATLAAIMGMTANALGLPRESRNWWRSARHCAEIADNRDLKVWVQGYESVDALYQGRPFRLVLDRADAAIRLSNGESTPGVLEAMACKAQVLAQIGATDDAQVMLRQARRTFEALSPTLTVDRSSLLTWPEQRLLHTESFVYSIVGPAKQATQAHTAALAAYAPDRIASRAQLALHQATTLIRDADIGDGIGHAERVLAELPATYHTRYVRVIAGKVLEAVPPKEIRRPVVNEYRERLALPSPIEK